MFFKTWPRVMYFDLQMYCPSLICSPHLFVQVLKGIRSLFLQISLFMFTRNNVTKKLQTDKSANILGEECCSHAIICQFLLKRCLQYDGVNCQ